MTGLSNKNPFRGKWIKAACQVAGSGHLQNSIPCQDRAGGWISPRPCLAVLDGRGSASHSHVGAHAALHAIRTTIRKSEPQLKALLDVPGDQLAAVGWRGFSQMIYHNAASEQLKLARWYEAHPDQFEFTLTLAIIGTERIGWLSVGDSPLVVTRRGIDGLATPLAAVEFANQTTFVNSSPNGGRLGMTGGLIASSGVSALLAMSDGSASRLVHLAGQTPAAAVSELSTRLARKELNEKELKQILADPSWDRVTRDDRSIAIIALRTHAQAEAPTSRDVLKPASIS